MYSVNYISVFNVLNYLLFIIGQLIEQSAKTFFNTCQRCKLEKGAAKCEFVGCEKMGTTSEVICSEVESICSITLICDNTVVFTKIMITNFELITFNFSLQIIILDF